MEPSSRIDKMIGGYIQNQSAGSFDNILSNDERLEAAWYLSELPNGLLGWYPFDRGGAVLQIGSWFGAFTEMLCSRCRKITIVERDSYRACMTEKRLASVSNLAVIHGDAADYCKGCGERFDYAVFVVDENIDCIPDMEAYTELLKAVKGVLKDNGKILLALPNRLGVKYFCGAPDPCTKQPFDGMTEDSSGLYRFDRKGLLEWAGSLGFPYMKLYYPMPDHHHTQIIYTDQLRPGPEALERLHIYSDHKTRRLLDEWALVGRLAENGVLHCFSNSFLLEVGAAPCSGVIYCALSVERGRDRAFATNIYENGTVEKAPLYPDGETGIRRLLENTRELSERGIPVLQMEEMDGRAVMERVQRPSLSVYLRDVSKKDRDRFIECMDRLWGYICASSEHVAAGKNSMGQAAPDRDWGIILKKAYIEMIPVNCFCDAGDMLFYDQEFTRDNCPAGYVMFRALRDIYTFSPEIKERVPLDFMKERYGLASVWELYAKEEEKFQTELRRRDTYSGFYYWIKHLFHTVQKNRRSLQAADEEKEGDYFNVGSDLDGRRIILFGSGRMAQHYLNRYGREHPPVFLLDNDKDRWGSKKYGLEIKAPDAASRLMEGTYRIVVAIKNYEPVVRQLEGMGIGRDSYRIYDREIDALADGRLKNPATDGKYNVGYTAGAFDSFSMGSLLWLEKCKARCHYLVVGVYTDGAPGQEERLALVKQCKYVDRAILVNRHSSHEIEMWREIRFGCLFIDEGYGDQDSQLWLRRKLRSLGSEMEVVHISGQ